MKKDNNEFAEMFYEFDIDKYNDEKVKKYITELEEEKRDLKKQIKRLKKQIGGQVANKKHSKKYTYEEMFDEIKKEYSFLAPESLTILATAEYFYHNEKENLDYTGVFLSYVKVFERELRKVLKVKSERVTLGVLLQRLKEKSDFKTFIKALERIKVNGTRNSAVHIRSISKSECGKIRDLLLEERWLDRLSYIIESEKFLLKDIDVNIEGYEGKEKYNSQLYNCYLTDEGEYVLSKKILKNGRIIEKAKGINQDGIDYLILN